MVVAAATAVGPLVLLIAAEVANTQPLASATSTVCDPQSVLIVNKSGGKCRAVHRISIKESSYTYSVDGSAFTATTVYNNLAAGTHTVDVTDANGCVFATTAAINNTGGPTAVATTQPMLPAV